MTSVLRLKIMQSHKLKLLCMARTDLATLLAQLIDLVGKPASASAQVVELRWLTSSSVRLRALYRANEGEQMKWNLSIADICGTTL